MDMMCVYELIGEGNNEVIMIWEVKSSKKGCICAGHRRKENMIESASHRCDFRPRARRVPGIENASSDTYGKNIALRLGRTAIGRCYAYIPGIGIHAADVKLVEKEVHKSPSIKSPFDDRYRPHYTMGNDLSV